MALETRPATAARPPERTWSERYLARKGIGAGAFEQRLARARMLHLRRREAVWYWLALAIVVGCWDIAGRLDPQPAHFAPQAQAIGVTCAQPAARPGVLPEASGGTSACLGPLALSFSS